MVEKILTVLFAIAVSPVAIAVPRMALDVQNVDFGDVQANETLVREVRIGNSGAAPLSVSRVKACCGAKAALEDLLIQTGTSSVLRVELNPGAFPGSFLSSLLPARTKAEETAVRDAIRKLEEGK